MNSQYIEFNKNDRIYKIIITKDESNNILRTIDRTEIYKIISVRNEFYGDSYNGYLSRYSAVIIPEKYISEYSTESEVIQKYGDYFFLQSVSDTHGIMVYAEKVN